MNKETKKEKKEPKFEIKKNGIVITPNSFWKPKVQKTHLAWDEYPNKFQQEEYCERNNLTLIASSSWLNVLDSNPESYAEEEVWFRRNTIIH